MFDCVVSRIFVGRVIPIRTCHIIQNGKLSTATDEKSFPIRNAVVDALLDLMIVSRNNFEIYEFWKYQILVFIQMIIN